MKLFILATMILCISNIYSINFEKGINNSKPILKLIQTKNYQKIHEALREDIAKMVTEQIIKRVVDDGSSFINEFGNPKDENVVFKKSFSMTTPGKTDTVYIFEFPYPAPPKNKVPKNYISIGYSDNETFEKIVMINAIKTGPVSYFPAKEKDLKNVPKEPIPSKDDTLKTKLKSGVVKYLFWKDSILIENVYSPMNKLSSSSEFKPMLENETKTFSFAAPGEPFKTYIKQKIKNGNSIEWYENGKKKNEGEFLNMNRQGKWIFWNEDGTIKEIKMYDAGRVITKQ